MNISRRLRITTLVLAVAAAGVAYVHEPKVEMTPVAPVYLKATQVPPQPRNAETPMSAVLWLINYDLRPFDETDRWLQTLPDSARRDRALGLMSLIATAELGQAHHLDRGIAAFARAESQLPEDARMPAWRTYLEFLKVRDDPEVGHDPAHPRMARALEALRVAGRDYPQFALFGWILGVGCWEHATPELVKETQEAVERVVKLTGTHQWSRNADQVERSRRVAGDTPIAPYNVLVVLALRGDLALRVGDRDAAKRHFYTALHTNHSDRWPWRHELEDKLDNVDTWLKTLQSSPNSMPMFACRSPGSVARPAPPTEPTFAGRVGNGMCTNCHGHVSRFDHDLRAADAESQIGWIRGRVRTADSVPHPVFDVFALPSPSKSARPTGFSIGLTPPLGVANDFYKDDKLYDGTFMMAVPAGSTYVAARTRARADSSEDPASGIAKTHIGLPWSVPVEAGMVTDITAYPIVVD